MATSISDLRVRLRTTASRLEGLRAYDPHRRRSRLAGPLTVQIQTVDRCNAACVMCPYSYQARSGPPHHMSGEVYTRILDETRRAGTVRGVCLMLQNEPLLDRRLAERVGQAQQILGNRVRVTTVTNGALLTPDRIDELSRLGLHRISVSIDAYHEATFTRIRQGLDFKKVVQNAQRLIERMGGERVTVRFLRQRANEGEEAAFARFWKSRGARVRFDQMTNRAGTLDEFERIRSVRRGPVRACADAVLNRLSPSCPLPFSTVCVLWDGRAILCCHDWEPRDVVGDLSEQRLAEVWNGEAINHYRHFLWTRRTAESLVCKDCSLAKGFWNT